MFTRKAFAAIGLALLTAAAIADDFPPADTIAGVQDHALLSRYAGSRLVGYLSKKYDETALPAGKYKNGSGKSGTQFEKMLNVEGRITRIAYNYPADRSGLEVMRNYLAAISAAGMSIEFRCDKDACGGAAFGGEFYNAKLDSKSITFSSDRYNTSAPFNYGRSEPRYVLASTTRADGAKTYAMVYVVPPTRNANGGVYIEIVEPEAMEAGKVAVNLSAEQMARSVSSDGKVALYGLYFDTDKAELRPDSTPTLDEMAKMLRQDPKLNIYIVGHTDNQGTLAHNLDLSQKRAEAVMHALTDHYHIDAARLTARGVASLAPVSATTTEAGRAKNRRVELVQQ